MVKNLTIALMDRPYLEATTKDLCDQIVQGVFSRVSKKNEALWKRKPHWFSKPQDKCLKLETETTGQVHSIPYEKAIFSSPLLFVYKRKGEIVCEKYLEPREFATTDPAIPAQVVISAKELNHMGFKIKSRL